MIIIFTSIISLALPSNAASLTTYQFFPEYGPIIFLELILLIILFEVLSTTKLWSKSLKTSLEMGIFPLLFSFFVVIVFKIGEVL